MCRIEIINFENCFHRDARVDYCPLSLHFQPPHKSPFEKPGTEGTTTPKCSPPGSSCPLDRNDTIYVTRQHVCYACVRYRQLGAFDAAEFRREVTVVMEGRFQTFRNWKDGDRLPFIGDLAILASQKRRRDVSTPRLFDTMHRQEGSLLGRMKGELKGQDTSDDDEEEEESDHDTDCKNEEP
ncbi:hypothetical protein AA313_de0207944 [Arthrobotrys entomopaga]|nr:hypothetical protein AA313_de0207944 [Arthrobotrys entomopaga]